MTTETAIRLSVIMEFAPHMVAEFFRPIMDDETCSKNTRARTVGDMLRGKLAIRHNAEEHGIDTEQTIRSKAVNLCQT